MSDLPTFELWYYSLLCFNPKTKNLIEYYVGEIKGSSIIKTACSYKTLNIDEIGNYFSTLLEKEYPEGFNIKIFNCLITKEQ